MQSPYRDDREAARARLEVLRARQDALAGEIAELECVLEPARRHSRRRLWALVPGVVILLLGQSYILFPVTCGGPSKQDAARAGADRVRNAAELYRNLDAPTGACPTLEHLVDKWLDARKTIDPWGEPYEIRCGGDGVSVRSRGPDRGAGTADDIVSPR